MTAKRTTTKRTHTPEPERSLRLAFLALVSARIPFKTHYPTKNSMVITIDSGLTNNQLRTVIDYGGTVGPDRNIIILIPKLSNDG
jgi:hypothetical protein